MHYDVTLDFNGTNTISITSGARTASTSRTPESTPVFYGVCAAQALVFCVVCCK